MQSLLWPHACYAMAHSHIPALFVTHDTRKFGLRPHDSILSKSLRGFITFIFDTLFRLRNIRSYPFIVMLDMSSTLRFLASQHPKTSRSLDSYIASLEGSHCSRISRAWHSIFGRSLWPKLRFSFLLNWKESISSAFLLFRSVAHDSGDLAESCQTLNRNNSVFTYCASGAPISVKSPQPVVPIRTCGIFNPYSVWSILKA